MTLLIHIGTDKTGSTALQTTLSHQNNAAALTFLKINYVKAGRGGANHQNLYWKALENNFDLWQQTADEVKNNPDQLHLVSFEGFYHLREEAWLKIKDILSGIDIKIVLYLRRQSDWVCSGIAQRFKSGENLPLKSYNHEVIFSHRQNYAPILARLENIFTADELIIRRYETAAMREGNLYVDFFDAVGAQISTAEFNTQFHISPNQNPTLDVESMYLLDQLDQAGIDKDLRKQVVKLLLPMCKNSKSTIVPADTAKQIDESFNKINQTISQKWFSSDVLFSEPSRFIYAEPDEKVIASYRQLISPIIGSI